MFFVNKIVCRKYFNTLSPSQNRFLPAQYFFYFYFVYGIQRTCFVLFILNKSFHYFTCSMKLLFGTSMVDALILRKKITREYSNYWFSNGGWERVTKKIIYSCWWSRGSKTKKLPGEQRRWIHKVRRDFVGCSENIFLNPK